MGGLEGARFDASARAPAHPRLTLVLAEDHVGRGFAAESLIAGRGAEGMKLLLPQERPAQRPHRFGLPDPVERRFQGVPCQKTLPFPVAAWITVPVRVDVKAVEAVRTVEMILGDYVGRPVLLLRRAECNAAAGAAREVGPPLISGPPGGHGPPIVGLRR